jgi:PadR family transcriptional regulator PadR
LITVSEKEVRTKLAKGLIDVIIMQFLEREPMHGYQIITNIRKNFGIYLGPSTIYPILNSLEETGHLKSEWNNGSGRQRKVFYLTAEGLTALKSAETSLNMIRVVQAKIRNGA